MIKVSTLKKNPNNPRQIRGEKLELLKKSITEFEKMMELRPMIIDENNTILGGNMRLSAIKALGIKEIPDSWIKRADNLTDEEKREFIIKDNNSFGEYDWDALANEWSDLPLQDWGLDLPDFDAVGNQTANQNEVDLSLEKIYGGATSMQRASAPIKFWKDNNYLSGDILDFGCGQETHEWQKYDSFTQPDTKPLIKYYDTVMCNYVLNVQPSDHLIVLIVGFVSKLLRENGNALFAMRNDLPLGRHESERGIQIIKNQKEWTDLLSNFFSVEQVEKKKFLGFVCSPKGCN